MDKQLLPDLDVIDIRHLLQIFKVNNQAMWNYQPRIYPGKIIFFRAKEKDTINAKNSERAWIDLAQEGLEVIVVPGNHMTMNEPPHMFKSSLSG
jgi:phthiocerol/phenolphthiocerol synthesis type-I polyketide synthase E